MMRSLIWSFLSWLRFFVTFISLHCLLFWATGNYIDYSDSLCYKNNRPYSKDCVSDFFLLYGECTLKELKEKNKGKAKTGFYLGIAPPLTASLSIIG
jgi:hypothetical protein